MLIRCPECSLQVSDKAISCPHCGYPLKDIPPKIYKQTRKKHRKLPNGFGQITEIKGKYLRKPFRAMVTVGKTSEGKPVCRLLKPESYFATYNEAYAALVEYNKNPYDLDEDLTMQELYELWSKRHLENIKGQSGAWIPRAWKYCNKIYNLKVREVRTRHIKGCVENGFILVNGQEKRPPKTLEKNIKSMLNMMMDYAVEYELTDRNYARSFNLGKDIDKEIKRNRKDHISFSDEEMRSLWGHVGEEAVELILIQCYTGLRPQELCLITVDNVNLDKKYMIGGMKTDAGENRRIPIHSAILPYVEKWMCRATEIGSDYVFNIPTTRRKADKHMTYQSYKNRFDEVIVKYNLDPRHRPHDPRKQFATMAKKYNVDEYAIKMIIGHSIDDITEKIYTDRDPQWLNEEIEKIKADVYCTNAV